MITPRAEGVRRMYEINRAPIFPAANIPLRCAPQASDCGNLKIDGSYSDAAAITPSATVLAGGGCDAVMVSASANVSGTTYDGGTISELPLLAGYVYPIRFAAITSVSSGTATALWYRRRV